MQSNSGRFCRDLLSSSDLSDVRGNTPWGHYWLPRHHPGHRLQDTGPALRTDLVLQCEPPSSVCVTVVTRCDYHSRFRPRRACDTRLLDACSHSDVQPTVSVITSKRASGHITSKSKRIAPSIWKLRPPAASPEQDAMASGRPGQVIDAQLAALMAIAGQGAAPKPTTGRGRLIRSRGLSNGRNSWRSRRCAPTNRLRPSTGPRTSGLDTIAPMRAKQVCSAHR